MLFFLLIALLRISIATKHILYSSALSFDEIVKFIKRKVFFDTPFLLKDDTRFHVTTDSETAINYATNENSVDFSDWQTLWDSELEKAGVYENMTDHIEYKINEFLENEFNYSKDFSNATNKVGYDEGAKISLLFQIE